jgi:hypothetical protein
MLESQYYLFRVINRERKNKLIFKKWLRGIK